MIIQFDNDDIISCTLPVPVQTSNIYAFRRRISNGGAVLFIFEIQISPNLDRISNQISLFDQNKTVKMKKKMSFKSVLDGNHLIMEVDRLY